MIVGRPNVGKSTLFNRLYGRRRAITDPTPGVTRDAIEEDCIIADIPVTLVDTGGVKAEYSDDFDDIVSGKSLEQLKTADIILFLIENGGLSAEDDLLVEKLRSYKDKVVLVVNKADTPEKDYLASEYYSLGLGDPLSISADHGRNIDILVNNIRNHLVSIISQKDPATEDDNNEPKDLLLALVGKPNVGKSTLANRLTGAEKSLVSEIAGTTRDTVVGTAVYKGRRLRVVDTAGMRRKSRVSENVEYYSVNRAIRAMFEADVTVLLIDANEGLSDQDKKISAQAVKKGRTIVLALNKWDDPSVAASKLKIATDRIRFQFPVLDWAPLVPISARNGHGVPALLDMILKADRQQSHRVETGELNRALREWVDLTPPPMHKGRPFKVRYATQVSVKPVRFVAFINRKAGFPDSYRRFLVNQIRREFGFSLVPVELELREGKKMTSSARRLVVSLAVCMVVAMVFGGALGADEASLRPYRAMLERSGFPENDETRQLLSEAVNAPALPAVETPFKINRQFSDGRRVQFEVRRAVTDWYLIFRNQRGDGLSESYPLWGRGNWIIKKDLLTGAFIQAKIFLQDDEESFVRLFPTADGRSRLDVHLYGRRIGDDVLIPVPFDQLVLSSFARLVSLTDLSIDWDIIFPDPDNFGYRVVQNFVSLLRPYADRIVEVPDAAVDRGGRNVRIEDSEPIEVGTPLSRGGVLKAGEAGLNCSGYVKWVADGLYSSWTDSPGSLRLALKDLREPSSRFNRNPWSDSRSAVGKDAREELESLLRDPRFGLDWNRNLARKIEEARLGRSISADEWNQLDSGELAGIPYRQDLGYNLDDLDSVLYQLASRRPGSVYFAAVNSRFVPEPTPEDPDPLALHQYWHVSVLAPWFDNGGFHVAVLDVGNVSESLLSNPRLEGSPSFPALINSRAIKYARLGNDDSKNAQVPEVMVHLVRADVPFDFQPTPLPEAR